MLTVAVLFSAIQKIMELSIDSTSTSRRKLFMEMLLYAEHIGGHTPVPLKVFFFVKLNCFICYDSMQTKAVYCTMSGVNKNMNKPEPPLFNPTPLL